MPEPSGVLPSVPDAGAAIAPIPPPLRRRPSRIDPDEPPSMGRGGREHTYLQNLIKEFALSKGFKAVIEEPILGGAGRVDVAISHEKQRLACEISVTTGRDHELGNIEKCVAAGFDSVIFVCRDARHRAAMARATKASLEDGSYEKVRFFDPEGALAYIASVAPDQGAATVRGYKVKVSHVVTDEKDMAKRRAAIAGVIARSIKKPGK